MTYFQNDIFFFYIVCLFVSRTATRFDTGTGTTKERRLSRCALANLHFIHLQSREPRHPTGGGQLGFA
jgi:hypothetical protein